MHASAGLVTCGPSSQPGGSWLRRLILDVVAHGGRSLQRMCAATVGMHASARMPRRTPAGRGQDPRPDRPADGPPRGGLLARSGETFGLQRPKRLSALRRPARGGDAGAYGLVAVGAVGSTSGIRRHPPLGIEPGGFRQRDRSHLPGARREALARGSARGVQPSCSRRRWRSGAASAHQQGSSQPDRSQGPASRTPCMSAPKSMPAPPTIMVTRMLVG